METSELEQGLLTDVEAVALGSELTEDHAVNATVLNVYDASDFSEEGGRLKVLVEAEDEVSGTPEVSHVLTYLSADHELNTITLTSALTVALEAEMKVLVDPPDITKWGQVLLDDGDEAVVARFEYQLGLGVDEGIRAEEDQELVVLQLKGTELVIVDVPGKKGYFDGSSIDPETLPETSGGGSQVYHQPNAPWADGTAGQPDNTLWYDTDHPDGVTPFLWDAEQALWLDVSDPQVDVLDDAGTILIGDQTLQQIAEQAQNASETATRARNLASTADGRVSFSDYDPEPDDVMYYVTDIDGNLAPGTSFEIQQAALSGGVATLTLADEAMTTQPGQYIIVEGVGFPFDGEKTVLANTTASVIATEFSITGGVVTVTLASAPPWQVGQTVNVYSVGAAVDGQHTLTAVGASSVSYALADSVDTPATPVSDPDASVTVYSAQYRVPGEADVALHAVPDAAIGYNSILQNRVNGSVWFTRTRARRSYHTNPSFEVDLAGWSWVAATVDRVDPVQPNVPTNVKTPIAGEFVARVSNDATTGDHRLEWSGGTPGMAVSEGETYASTAFALLESGSGVGAYASVRFYDSVGGLVDEVEGPGESLLIDDWVELTVSGTVPTGATHMAAVVLHNPNPSDVWLVDASLIEQGEYTGRYFDGDSYDADWVDPATAHISSQSTLVGGKIISVWELADNNWVRLDFTDTTQYDQDAGDLTKGILSPERLADNSVPIDKLKTNSIQVSDTVDAGDLVNIFRTGDVYLVRPADASLGREAHGFVYQTAAPGTAVPVYTMGINSPVSGLAPGTVFLGNSGGVSPNPPQTVGSVVQEVGVASDSSTLHFIPRSPIWLK